MTTTYNAIASEATYTYYISVNEEIDPGSGDTVIVSKLEIRNSSNPSILINDSYTTEGEVTQIVVDETAGYAYLMNINTGIEIVKLPSGSSTNPVIEGSINIFPTDIALLNNNLYIGSDQGLSIYDITNKANPTKVTVTDLETGDPIAGNNPLEVKVQPNGNVYAYVADSNYGLRIFNVTNPGSATSTGGLDIDNIVDLAVAGNYAYIISASAAVPSKYKLEIYDVSNPSTPTLVTGSLVDSLAFPTDIIVSGNTVFLPTTNDGLRIINVDFPNAPVLQPQSNPDNTDLTSAIFVEINGNKLYYISSDASILQTPQEVATLVNDRPTDLSITNTIFKENQASNTLIGSFDTVDPDSQDFTYTLLSVDGNANDNTLFTIGGNEKNQLIAQTSFDFQNKSTYDLTVRTTDLGGLSREEVFTINIVQQFIFEGQYDTPGNAYGVDVVGNTAYIADGNSGLRVVDISNPSSPTFQGTYDTNGSAWGVTVAGNYAYVADYNAGLKIINIANPNAPTLSGTFQTSGLSYNVTVAGNNAYVANGYTGIQIIDISNPNAPTLKGSFDTTGFAREVTVVNNTAYVADGFSGLQILNISNPNAPTLIKTVNTPGYARGVTVVGNTAYVADSDKGLQIIDITNPNTAAIVGERDTPGSAAGVAVDGTTAYVADSLSGLQLIDISNPNSPYLLDTFATQNTNNASGVTLENDIAFIAYGASGLQLINTNPGINIQSAGESILNSTDLSVLNGESGQSLI